VAQGSEPVAGTSFERHVIKDATGRDVTYYISRPKDGPAPLMLMIQGSGCLPVMNPHSGGTYSTLSNLLPFGSEGRFTVVAVEKPFSAKSDARPGTANGCSAAFNESFTAESWLLALQAGLQDARKYLWVDPKRTLVFGGSEGAVMAALLAAKDARITDVVAIGGSGTTQLYDFIAQAYRTCFNVAACLADVDSQVRAIAADPSSSTAFAWGHPHKRWTSFFRVDPSEELLRSKARVYLVFGTADNAVPALSQEIAVAKLTAAGRDVTVRRVADADHSLRQPGAANLGGLDKESRAALDWFWQRR
jgi:pimeloyl-ACP methyl ester carboxylesterase